MADFELTNALINTYNNYGLGIDTKNWQLVRDCFADQIKLDYGELSEATVGTNVACAADDWLAILQASINGFDITRHQITNHRISTENDRVCCVAYLQAGHVIFQDGSEGIITPNDEVTLVGEYTNYYQQVAGQWKIEQSALSVAWVSGNPELFAVAQARAAESAE